MVSGTDKIFPSKFVGRDDELSELKRFADEAYYGKGRVESS